MHFVTKLLAEVTMEKLRLYERWPESGAFG